MEEAILSGQALQEQDILKGKKKKTNRSDVFKIFTYSFVIQLRLGSCTPAPS